MPLIRNLMRKLSRVHYGLDSRSEFVCACFDRIFRTSSASRVHIKRLLNTPHDSEAYILHDVRLPVVSDAEKNTMRPMNILDEDILCSYLHFNDDYSEKTFALTEPLLPEGLYSLIDDKVNVSVKAGDIVIDAGSCCGTFSAYASAKGAISYAFEPVAENFAYLTKTAKLNKNIHPVNAGLSDENTSRNIFVDPQHLSGSSFLEELKPGISGTQVQTVRLDDFVRENHLPRVDFIKADIEGFERHMLAGAQETLALFAPKLALCTYHLPDDPEVMASLILKANPKYNIIQKRKKLFASVPE